MEVTKSLITKARKDDEQTLAELNSARPRENDRTEREAEGLGRDMSCPRKLLLAQRKYRFSSGSLFSETSACTCLALRFSVTLRPPLHEILVFLSNIRPRLACMRTSRKTDFHYNKDFRSSKNNFRGHDISQGLDREPPSLSPHFLLAHRNPQINVR